MGEARGMRGSERQVCLRLPCPVLLDSPPCPILSHDSAKAIEATSIILQEALPNLGFPWILFGQFLRFFAIQSICFRPMSTDRPSIAGCSDEKCAATEDDWAL